MSIAPFFSKRAHERRTALRRARGLAPASFVTLVLGYPLETLADGDFRQPRVLDASARGVDIRSLDGLTAVWSAPWTSIPPIAVTLEDVVTPVMTIGDRKWFGVHTTGSFALSYQQLQRLAAKIESKRAAG